MAWNPLALADALQTWPDIDIKNSENALIMKMNDYGDLQINIIFTSRQIIIETFICPVSCIKNREEFNLFLLRNQKLMPLSSVGISSIQHEEYYVVFGALCSRCQHAECAAVRDLRGTIRYVRFPRRPDGR